MKINNSPSFNSLIIRPLIFSLLLVTSFIGLASEEGPSEGSHDTYHEKEEFDPAEMISHHILDGHEWEIAHGVVLPLPVILYSEEKGLDVFMSSNFYNEHHQTQPYKGYVMDHGHITLESGGHVLDFSITKNVLFLFINVGLLLFIFISVARGCKKNEGKAPRGIQSFFEPIIIFVRDEIVRPNIGAKADRYMPYMLSLFFFIWFGNILGLLPGAANLTGNIAVTMVLAIFTFFITQFSGNRNHWKHVFWTPGVPVAIKPIMIIVEFIGLFTKPFSLMIRLFVAITAGHIVLLSLIGLIFIFGVFVVSLGVAPIVIFITFIEILVATIQAYVFTLFSSLYIGMATADDH